MKQHRPKMAVAEDGRAASLCMSSNTMHRCAWLEDFCARSPLPFLEGSFWKFTVDNNVRTQTIKHSFLGKKYTRTRTN